MADFSDTDKKLQSINQAANLRPALRGLYAQAKAVQSLMALYQAGTDTAFNTAINAIYNSAQRTELADMSSDISVLAAHLEANHASALGIEEQA